MQTDPLTSVAFAGSRLNMNLTKRVKKGDIMIDIKAMGRTQPTLNMSVSIPDEIYEKFLFELGRDGFVFAKFGEYTIVLSMPDIEPIQTPDDAEMSKDELDKRDAFYKSINFVNSMKLRGGKYDLSSVDGKHSGTERKQGSEHGDHGTPIIDTEKCDICGTAITHIGKRPTYLQYNEWQHSFGQSFQRCFKKHFGYDLNKERFEESSKIFFLKERNLKH